MDDIEDPNLNELGAALSPLLTMDRIVQQKNNSVAREVILRKASARSSGKMDNMGLGLPSAYLGKLSQASPPSVPAPQEL